MPPAPDQPLRVAIVGASSLCGKELNQLLSEAEISFGDVRLLDDETVAGVLAEAGGEASFIQKVEEDSFSGARFVFFAGAREFTAQHWQMARRFGATVIDLSGELAGRGEAVAWIPTLDKVLPPPRAPEGAAFASPSAAAIVATTLAAALARFAVPRLVILLFRPAAERGQAGVDELEHQTVNLLSFQPVAREVFDAQVAFNFLTRYGEASTEQLRDVRGAIARDVAGYLAGRVAAPAIQLVQAPVFYSYVFAAYAEVASRPNPEEIELALAEAGARVAGPGEDAPSNISVAGGRELVMSPVERDPNVAAGYWMWGAADNVRLPAANAARIAAELLRRG